MPTDVIKTIGATSSPTVPDYTTLQAWEDACPANLVTADQRWIGECLDQGEFTKAGTGTLLNISGQTTDSTRYVYLRCATGASFKDKTGVRTTALDYNASNGVAIRNTGNASQTILASASFTRLEGLQAQYNGNYAQQAISLSTSCIASQCIAKCTASGGQPGSGINSSIFANCLLIAAGNGVGGRPQVYGCTVIRSGTAGGTGLVSQYGQSVVKNTAVFGFTTLSGTLAAGSDYNATDLATAWGTGTHNLNSLTFASQFVSTTNDFRSVVTGGLKAGTPDATNTPADISGFTRDLTTPYIGCWEVAAAATGVAGIIGGGVGSGAYVIGA